VPERQIKQIDIGDLAETVTTAVGRALEAQKGAALLRNPRIICGFILEPLYPPLTEPGLPRAQ
jgi:hypothetical protein